ncbi:MAG: GNAT family N-acetyltransferase [Scytonematopsis contorta HA4267-MV1]|jgi:N-acetylglutamate synthase-like GNAT family acetyltransferase|nr:GNAT family N-acetyltransferase [Scytonematopsis contorta HA4267-MV1]
MTVITKPNLFNKQKLQIQIVKDFDKLQCHADSWNRLAFEATQQLPMSSYAWVSSYFEHYLQATESWICLFAYQGSELVGVMPLIVTPKYFLGFEFILLLTRNSTQSCSIDILAKKGLENIVIPTLIDAAKKSYSNLIGIRLERLPDNSPTIVVLENLPNVTLVKEFDSVGAYLKITDSFEQYRANLSSNFRSNLNKAAKKLHQLTGVKISLLTKDNADVKFLSELIDVEVRSWKGSTGTAICDSLADIFFYKSLTSRLLEAGLLEWHILEAEGKVIAINLAVRLKRVILVWKLAYDPNYSKCSPGSILMEQVVKSACESDNIDEINLMTDHAWYDNWKMDKRDYYNIRLYPHTAISFLLGFLPMYIRQKLRKLKQK